mgnify:FL=1
MRIISGNARGTKLYTLEGLSTRPTLDRVKESMFNIIQQDIPEAIVLDLFAGCGAIGLEMVSRGAKQAVLCDNSKQAIKIIEKNIEKTHMEKQIQLYNMDYIDCLEKVKDKKFDLIYIDPPYQTDYIEKALQKIIEYDIITNNSKIILETDDEKRITQEISNININIIDQRKYGRATLIFLKK